MTTAPEPLLRHARDPRGVLTLTLNRPQAFNALSAELLAALQDELDAVAAEESARVLVLAGAGRAFCAGHDLREMRARPELGYYRRRRAPARAPIRRRRPHRARPAAPRAAPRRVR